MTEKHEVVIKRRIPQHKRSIDRMALTMARGTGRTDLTRIRLSVIRTGFFRVGCPNGCCSTYVVASAKEKLNKRKRADRLIHDRMNRHERTLHASIKSKAMAVLHKAMGRDRLAV